MATLVLTCLGIHKGMKDTINFDVGGNAQQAGLICRRQVRLPVQKVEQRSITVPAAVMKSISQLAGCLTIGTVEQVQQRVRHYRPCQEGCLLVFK